MRPYECHPPPNPEFRKEPWMSWSLCDNSMTSGDLHWWKPGLARCDFRMKLYQKVQLHSKITHRKHSFHQWKFVLVVVWQTLASKYTHRLWVVFFSHSDVNKCDCYTKLKELSRAFNVKRPADVFDIW